MKNFPAKRNAFGLNFFGDDFFRPFFNFEHSYAAMKTDVREDEKSYTLEIEMPGISKENIELNLEDGYLNITTAKESVNEQKDESCGYVCRERYSGSFSRSYYVGSVDEKDIEAALDGGILKVTFPKQSPKQLEKRKRIDIK